MADEKFQPARDDLGQKERSVKDIALNNLRNILIDLVGTRDVKALIDPLSVGSGLIQLRYLNIPLLAVTIYYYQQFPIRFPAVVNSIEGRPAVLVYRTDNFLTQQIYERILNMEQFNKINAENKGYVGFQSDLLRYLALYIGFIERNDPSKPGNRENELYQKSWII